MTKKQEPAIVQNVYYNGPAPVDKMQKLASYAVALLAIVVGIVGWFGGMDYLPAVTGTGLLIIAYEIATLREAIKNAEAQTNCNCED